MPHVKPQRNHIKLNGINCIEGERVLYLVHTQAGHTLHGLL